MRYWRENGWKWKQAIAQSIKADSLVVDGEGKSLTKSTLSTGKTLDNPCPDGEIFDVEYVKVVVMENGNERILKYGECVESGLSFSYAFGVVSAADIGSGAMGALAGIPTGSVAVTAIGAALAGSGGTAAGHIYNMLYEEYGE